MRFRYDTTGTWLKGNTPNPSRRSAHHTRQSTFEGSRRQKRARLLRLVMEGPGGGVGDYAVALSEAEVTDGRDRLTDDEVRSLLDDLQAEGFVSEAESRWFVRS